MPPTPAPDPRILTGEPTERELRGMREVVRDSLGGVVLEDSHSERKYRYKPVPGKFKSQIADLATCDRDHVICEIPVVDDPYDEDPPMMRICLVCDAGREMLGLNGKPIP